MRAALCDPVSISATLGPADFAFALGGFLLAVWKASPSIVVLVYAAGGIALVTR